MADQIEENMDDTVEELRAKLEAMKKLVENDTNLNRRKEGSHTQSTIIDGNFLSCVFVTAVCVILGVAFYAFSHLYGAIMKKFPIQKHSEL